MIRLSGKHFLADPRAYALICPASEESGESEVFGFAPKLADLLLSWKGWWNDMPAEELEAEIEDAQRADKTLAPDLQRKRIRTPDEINACIQALLDPRIDAWGYRLVEAQRRVTRAAALLLPLDDLIPHYEGPETDDEIEIREWIEWNVRDCWVKHVLLDAMIEYDRDLDAPGLLAQIHRQIDEDCD
jgi:hypothetical protein